MNDLHTTPSFKALDEGRLQPVDKGVTLKPCPFCGCRHATTASGQAEFDDEPDWATACAACHAEVWGNTEAEAIAAWNHRHQSGRTGAGEALRGAILWAQDDKCSYPADAEKFEQRIEILRAALSQSTAGEDGT